VNELLHTQGGEDLIIPSQAPSHVYRNSNVKDRQGTLMLHISYFGERFLLCGSLTTYDLHFTI